MARRGFRERASEAVPKVFQTFNSLLGSIVRKKNATIVGPSKQLVGEFPPVTFDRLFEFYHHWDQIKRSVDTSHQKLVGAGIEIQSNNEYFNVFIEKWWNEVNAGKKFSEYFLSGLITGNAIMEIQYTADGRIGNIEHIPMQTIFRIFRDQFANELKLVQVVDGVFKELDPEFFMHWMINNPDRQAFGKSEFFSVASPRPVATKVDKFTGQPVNPDRNLRSLLDAQAILQNAEVEIKEKMGKPRLLVSAPGMPRDQMNEIQLEMADPQTDQYIWFFDKPVDSKELQIQAQTRFDDYGDNVDAHIDIATGFASKVISNPGGFSYSGSQTPLDVLDQRMIDMQKDTSELLIDHLLKPLAESWGFKEFEEMEVEITFTPNVKRLTMEDIRGLDPESVAPKEKRKMYEKLNIPLDDQLYDEFQNELKSDKQDQKDVGMAQAEATGFGAGQGGNSFGNSPAESGNPPKAGGDGGKSNAPPSEGGQSEKAGAGQSDVPPLKPLEDTPVKPDSEKDRPEPTRTDEQEPSPFRKKKGEALTTDDIGVIVAKAVEATLRAHERITLPPKAGSNANSSVDLYVSQGLDTPGKPEITDPNIRQSYGEDDEAENELPPNAPERQAHVDDPPILDPNQDQTDLMRQQKKGGVDFTNAGDQGIPQVDPATGQPISEPPMVGIADYVNELEGKGVQGDHTKGGTGDQRINQDSDGSFKDPLDLAQQQNEPAEPELGQQTQGTNIGPRAPSPDDLGRKLAGGYEPEQPDLKGLGSPDNDEQPFEKSEGFPKDDNPEEIEKLTNRQNLRGEGVGDKYPPQPQLPDAPEIPHRDMVKPEDSDPRLPYQDPNPELNQPQVGQARLDDTPLQEQPTNDPDGISPSREEPFDLQNNIDQSGGDGNAVEPAGGIGQSDQERLRREELTGTSDTSELPTIGDAPLDNTGLNMEPDPVGGTFNDPQRDQVTGITDPVEGQHNLQDNTIQDPIGNVPQDDGMIVKPEDTQQIPPNNGDPMDPNKGGVDMPAQGADPNEGTNIDQGVDPNEIDPNQLHEDPESGKLYTDQTDEQGNEVPDLRFDQTPDSDEKQPEVELENEIVTKEEYEQELEGQRVSNALPPPVPPMVSEDQFNAELDKQSIDPNELNVFDNTTPEEPEGRISKMLNQEEPEEEGWEPAFKEDEEKPELSKEVADGMRTQSDKVLNLPDGKVVGARFYDNRKKKDQSRETGTSAGAKKAWDTRGRGRKQEPKKEKGVTDDTRLNERKKAISDITNTFPKLFDHVKAEQQSIKAELLQDKHNDRVKEVYGNLSNKFPNVEITGRVKTTYSMLEKTARKSKEYPDVSDVADVSALRTMCKDLKEIGSVSAYIRDNFDVVEEENYIQKSKGGYRSIHMQIKDENGLLSEIQVRTPNQETWANWSHDNFYKPLDEDLKAFIETHFAEIDVYLKQMSDYYYKVDNGEKIERPTCPPDLIDMLGCME